MEKLTIKIESAAITDKGLSNKRPVNEDSYLEMPERGLFAVADGVGGAQAGDLASQTAMEVLQEVFSHPNPNLRTDELVKQAVAHANTSIYQLGRGLPNVEMMATTIVVLCLENTRAVIGHVGDSRLYRLHPNNKLTRETADHSMVEEEVRAGRMTVAQAANHPNRNVISRALGAESAVEIELRTIEYEAGSTFLICSDGITRHVSDDEIADVLQHHQSLREACLKLKAMCYARGAEDNLTALIVRAGTSATDSTVANFEPDATLRAVPPPPISANSVHLSEARTLETAAPSVSDEPETIFPPIKIQTPVNHTVAQVVAPTAPLETDSVNRTNLRPASQTIGTNFAPVAPDAVQPTLNAKIDNDRIRGKINNAAPVPAVVPQYNGGGSARLLTSLLMMLVGVALGAFVVYGLARTQPQIIGVNPAPEPTPQVPVSSVLTAQEINEYRMFEKVRRTVDAAPQAARTQLREPRTAADFYLQGRAFLLLGEYDKAREALNKARVFAGQSTEVNQKTLRVDIATAQAAVGAMTDNADADKKMLDEIVKKPDAAAPDNQPNAAAPNR